MIIPINLGNNVDVQRALHFYIDPSMTACQGREILRFWEFRCLMGSSLCSLLLRNYSTDFSPWWYQSTEGTMQICNVHFILILTPPWLQVKVTKYFDFVNLDVWRVVVCVHFSSETTQPISPMMIPINLGNNVVVQRALNFDLDPSMTAGQGHKILRFCAFRFLTGSSLRLLLLRNYLTKFSNADANLQREQCRFATYT